MCPDKQFLSVYFDGELPSPWKERMEQHLETCSGCRETLETYRKMSRYLNAGGEKGGLLEAPEAAVIEAAAGRVWERLEGRKWHSDGKLWRFLPARIPKAFTATAAGAIAATAIICFLFLFSQGQNSKNSVPQLTDAAENFAGIVPISDDHDASDIIPASNMDDILRYLESDDSSSIVIIKLPERKKFSRYGEPAFINASDYSRRTKK
ncbi:MAG: zf-HC2 domain-containing protein [Spirochaetaceae bacterium]|jgi:hypothetical protein|nr:zf-HC2 domain-containing protein [Spirochaetaceae bacterium]